ncbi:DUF3150 domain-containing protein, partial [Raoultella ornithinolytica]
AVGIRFLGGYAVPADRVNDLISALNDVKTEFYIYKNVFLQSDFDSWIDKCEEKYRKILRDGASVDLEYMDSQIQFGFTAIHITPYGNEVIQNGIAGQIKSLTDEVFDEVSGLVDGFLKNLNQNAFTQHTINPLRRTAEKLASLGFISDSVNKLALYMKEVLNDVPVSGKVTGRKYSDILSLLNNLRDPQRAKSFVDLLNADSTIAQSVADDFIDLSGSAGIVSADPVAPATQSVPVVTSPSSAPVAVDNHIVDASSYVPDEPYAESASVVTAVEVAQGSETALAQKEETITPEIVARADDGFATDLPSGDEVIVEPVVETSPAPVADDLAPASVEGFRNVVVVDGPLFNDAKVHRDLPDHNGIEVVAVDTPENADVNNSVISSVFDDEEDGVFLF